ncbi:M1 family metallopeptidase [candidate division WOR-3 bacterium]|uniref:M1 family metallopeptidase n=1 Tax=candidate division WOR-3 bacterium TaxID=2052148 RepID=A0A937XCA5_UNCW3|nr:M1 family metallopeptidase [candidate division WOR-3 bacterium]
MKRHSLLPLLLLAAIGAHAQPVEYTISARLDAAAGLISGSQTVHYRNLTPDTLGSLWLHLYPNAFRDRTTTYARELETMGRFDFSLSRPCDRGWIAVDSAESGGRVSLLSEAEDELGLFLDPPLAPGESLTIRLEFRTQVPVRLGEPARNGRSFVLAHWYPQVAARTTATGWLTGGYHVFGHSPSAFGNYHVTLDVPADLHFAAPGAVSDSPVPGTGRTVYRVDATNLSDLAVAAAPGMKRMSRSLAGTDITVLARSFANAEWFGALLTTADMLRRMQQWNGPFPFDGLTIVDGSGIVSQDASYPGLIVMATRPIPYTRLFEQALARQVALQWSACATGAEELSDPGIAQGLASYSEMRYLDEKYGRTSLLSNRLLSWALKGLNSEYYHKLYYYLGASNRVLCTDPAECRDQVGYVAAEQARPALLLRAEERRTGQAAFDSLMRNWIDSQAGAHPVRSDFAAHFPTVHAQLTGAVSADDILPTRLQSRRVQVRPIFALPSFTDYQIFYGPWIWADYYHGLELGIGIQGRQFLDGGPLRGRHQWSASEVYSFAIRDTHSSFSYQTPLTFINDRLRAYVALDYSTIDNGAKLFFTQELGPVFRQPKTTIDFGYRILNIKKLDLRDTVAWELARTADVRLRMAQTYESRLLLGGVQAYVRGGDRALGSNYSYVRAGLEQSHTYRGLRPVDLSIRLFGGYIWGDVPRQDEFYLSGGLTSNSSEPVSWAYEDWTSGQAHWHYDADANVRGYARQYPFDTTGGYKHGRAAYGINLEAALAKLGILSFHPFFDLGNVKEEGMPTNEFLRPRMDAGVRLKLGPVYADFPIWRYWPVTGGHQFAFRWMLGFKMGGILGGT